MKIDLSTPELEVTTAKVCPVNCYPYCPQTKFREVYGDRGDFLTYDDFKLALSHVPKGVRINFAGFSEPFLNKRAVDMIELAKAEDYTTTLYSTLVGLRAEDVKRLKCVDYFCLHLPDNRGVSHITLTPNYKDALAEAFKELKIDEYYRMDGVFWYHDRAGNCDNATPRHVRGPFWCSRLVKPQPTMLPNCDVVACCQDWSMKHRLGNLKEKTFEELVHGEEFRKMAAERWHLDGSTLCRSCNFAWSYPKTALVMVGTSRYVQEVRRKIMR
jgi:hypothetical protein